MFMIVQGQIYSKLQDQDVTFWNAFPQHQLLALKVSEGSSIISMQILIMTIKTNELLMMINNAIKI